MYLLSFPSYLNKGELSLHPSNLQAVSIFQTPRSISPIHINPINSIFYHFSSYFIYPNFLSIFSIFTSFFISCPLIGSTTHLLAYTSLAAPPKLNYICNPVYQHCTIHQKIICPSPFFHHRPPVLSQLDIYYFTFILSLVFSLFSLSSKTIFCLYLNHHSFFYQTLYLLPSNYY